jgi:hypothetical protein
LAAKHLLHPEPDKRAHLEVSGTQSRYADRVE